MSLLSELEKSQSSTLSELSCQRVKSEGERFLRFARLLLLVLDNRNNISCQFDFWQAMQSVKPFLLQDIWPIHWWQSNVLNHLPAISQKLTDSLEDIYDDSCSDLLEQSYVRFVDQAWCALNESESPNLRALYKNWLLIYDDCIEIMSAAQLSK